MKVLTLRQPWAWALFFAGKDIENRTWKTNYRGDLAIHTAKGMTKREYNEAKNFMLDIGVPLVPNPDELEFGTIVGIIEVVGCIHERDYNFGSEESAWFQGPYGWIVQNPRQVKPVEAKGGLSLWDYAGKLEVLNA